MVVRCRHPRCADGSGVVREEMDADGVFLRFVCELLIRYCLYAICSAVLMPSDTHLLYTTGL